MALLYNSGMELNFKNAVILSVIIHAAVMLPFYSSPVLKDDRIKHDKMIVDYIHIVRPKKIEVTRQKSKAISAIAMSVDTPKINLAPKIEMKPDVSAPPKANAAQQKKISAELAVKQARIRSTKDYVNYYQLIREKVRQKLKDRYRSYYGEGDISLVFDLRADGLLISVSAAPDAGAPPRDQALLDIAIQSLKEASPFDPFPRALALPQMSFTLTISFRKK